MCINLAGFRSSLNLFWALAGGLHDCAWNKLPEGERAALLLALEEAQGALAG